MRFTHVSCLKNLSGFAFNVQKPEYFTNLFLFKTQELSDQVIVKHNSPLFVFLRGIIMDYKQRLHKALVIVGNIQTETY